MNKLRFGIFMPPFNSPPTQNATSSLQRNLETLQLMDRLGYDEAWIGEHHSAGTEIIADPLTFIAHAGALTRHIKLGTGVVSLPYHHPLWIADRAILVDHLIRGRLMLGVGPGSLPTDSAMIGLNPTQTRELLETNLDVVMRLLRTDEPVTIDTGTHTLHDARLHLRPYSDPHFEVAVAAVASPTGPRLAGRHGVGLLSIGATLSADGFDALTHHWGVMEERAAAHNTTVDREKWRLVGLMHIAETREQAYRDVEYGIEQWFRYFQKVAAFPQMAVDGGDVREMIDFINEAGVGAIGTVEDARAQVQRLVDQSGGFGAMLLLAHEWANPRATKESYELFARYVMPRFQNSTTRLQSAERWAQHTQAGLDVRQAQALKEWTDKHAAERAAKQPLVAR